MEVIHRSDAFRAACDAVRAKGRSLALVPTMGALHGGHVALIRAARESADVVALSVFVNPLQFSSEADLAGYPRTRDRDLEVAGSEGVELVFVPDEREMYPGGPPAVTVDPGPLGDRLEGASRPGHFRGVLTVVAKLLHLAAPRVAVFGEKDAQQLWLVRRMVADLSQAVEIRSVPTVRGADGLALSSRNALLTDAELEAAPVLFEALSDAAVAVRAGQRDAASLMAAMARTIGSAPGARLDYVAVVDDETWADLEWVDRPARALVACRLGQVRLIDNLRLPVAAERAQ